MEGHVSIIFRDRPTQWGLRGDPYLWEDLENHFSNVPLPYSQADFEAEVQLFIETLTESKLEDKEDIFVRKYDGYGMSRGTVSCGFWVAHLIPLLNSRLDRVNREHRDL